MRDRKNPTIEEGCAYLEPVVWPWPPQETSLIVEERLGDGFFALGANANGQFIVQVVKLDPDNAEKIKFVHHAISCPVRMEQRIALKMSASWAVDGVTLYI